jgi:hypothetical protein
MHHSNRSHRIARAGRRSAVAAAVLGGVALVAHAASAFQITRSFDQQESRDTSGRVTVEAARIHVLTCNGSGENLKQVYVYEYLNRPGFRAILPPDWGRPLGGHDWSTFDDAAKVACSPSSVTPGP